MTRVLTVIVHHRGEEMLTQCLESVLASKGVDVEVVVVDNGMEESLPALTEESPRVHAVSSPVPLGFSEANNLGVAKARELGLEADLLYFLNNDTYSERAALASQAQVLDEMPTAAIVGPRLVIWGAEDHLNSLEIHVTQDGGGWDEGIGIPLAEYGPLPGRRSVLAVTGSALLVRASVFDEVEGWSEIYDYYYEDIDLCLKVRRAGYDVWNVPDAVVRHAVSATMVEGSARKEFLFRRNRLRLALVHWPLRLWPVLFGRAVGEEVFLTPLDQSSLSRRALLGALKRLPSTWELRRRSARGPNVRTWTRYLRPPGSVPPVELPDVCRLPIDERVADTRPLDESVFHGAADESPERAAWERRKGRRVLVVGWGPLPFEEARMNYAPGVRSWQLARSLAEDGHRVLLAVAWIPGTEDGSAGPSDRTSYRDGVRIEPLRGAGFGEGDGLPGLVKELDPEGLVGVSAVPAGRTVEIAGTRPLWIDLFGDPMAEAQAKAGVVRGEHVAAYRRLLQRLLDRGDRFSAVSERQKWAVVGQLGIRGRLGGETAGEELVHAIPCSVESMAVAADGTVPPGVVPDDSFVLLWGGGYNTWCDVDTLFEGLEEAMDVVPDLHFVSTGGAIEGHDESSYPTFERRVARSEHRGRYHLLGRLPKAEADAWVHRADLGVVTERSLYERDLGSSQRLYGWLAAGLPFVCTASSEVGSLTERRGLGFTYEVGDPDSLAAAIRSAAGDRGRLGTMARSATQWRESEGADRQLTEGLRSWAKRPVRSGDAELVDRRGPDPEMALLEEREALRTEAAALFRDLFHSRRSREGLEKELAHLSWVRSEVERLREFETSYHEVRGELGRIHESRMWKLWMTYLRLRGSGG